MSASQSPRLHVAPTADSTLGDLAGDLATAYGLAPDPWQQIVLDDWLAETRGRWTSLTCGLSVPRQNGKNALVEVRELFGMVGRGERILHTAHEVKTARKHFKRLQHFFGGQAEDPSAQFPELNAMVAEVRSTNGQEAIVLRNGGSVEIAARSKNSGRGFTVDVLVMDEAQEMSDDDIEALIPTTSAAPLGNPQWIFTGTPPGPKASGEVFTRVRTESLGKPKRQCWHEWSAPAGSDLDDRRVWRDANPGLVTGRLQIEVAEGERASFTDEGFGRERLGMWAEAIGTQVISEESWRVAADGSSRAVGQLALAVDVSPELASASVALAGSRSDGSWHVELADHRAGADWIPAYVRQLVTLNPQIRAVVVDVGSPAAAVVDDLVKAKVKVTSPTVREVGAACARFADGIRGGVVFHPGQPQMTVALAGARKRDLGDTGMWAWSRKNSSTDITPIVAATLALHGAQNSKAKKPTRSNRAVFA